MIVSYKLLKRFDEITTTCNNYVGNSSISFLDDLNRGIYDEYDDYDDEDEDYDDYETFVSSKNSINLISVYLAGSICEEIIFNDRSFNGYVDVMNAINDIEYMMGAGYFGYRYTVINNVDDSKPLTGKTRELVEDKKVEIMEEAHAIAMKIVSDNKELINKIYEAYSQEESLSKEELYKFLKEIK